MLPEYVLAMTNEQMKKHLAHGAVRRDSGCKREADFSQNTSTPLVGVTGLLAMLKKTASVTVDLSLSHGSGWRVLIDAPFLT